MPTNRPPAHRYRLALVVAAVSGATRAAVAWLLDRFADPQG
ncbi:hypothetical protein ACIHCQ_35065 [Streptomyces sp. NPDC052236]